MKALGYPVCMLVNTQSQSAKQENATFYPGTVSFYRFT